MQHVFVEVLLPNKKKPPKTIDTEPVACDEHVYLNLISFSQNFRKKIYMFVSNYNYYFWYSMYSIKIVRVFLNCGSTCTKNE